MPICYLEKGKTATTAPVPAEAEDGNKFSIQRVLLCGSWPCNCLLRWCLQGSTVPIRITTNAKLNARLVWNVREVELLLFKKWRSGSRRRLYNATGSRYTSAVAEENEGEERRNCGWMQQDFHWDETTEKFTTEQRACGEQKKADLTNEETFVLHGIEISRMQSRRNSYTRCQKWSGRLETDWCIFSISPSSPFQYR